MSYLNAKEQDNPKSLQNFPFSIVTPILNNLLPHKPKILVVDDEANIRRILETRLTMIGYDIVSAADGLAALSICRHHIPDLVILDVMLPKLDGFGVCQALRQQSAVPIIMLTGMADVTDRIKGLELGADDYMVKPFSPKELESRIRCILRRVEQTSTKNVSTSGVIQVGELCLDTNKRQVYRGKERIRLTDIEFSLLALLASRAGEAISRLEILSKVWGYTPDSFVDTRVVDVHISRLRDKLQADPNQLELIITVRGIGYALH